MLGGGAATLHRQQLCGSGDGDAEDESDAARALGDAAALAPWRAVRERSAGCVSVSRRLAGRLGHGLCRRVGSRAAARLAAALLWPAIVLGPPAALAAAFVFGLLAVVAVVMALPWVLATVVTGAAAVPYLAARAGRAS